MRRVVQHTWRLWAKPAFCSFFGTALPTVFSTEVPNPQIFNDFNARHLA
jgi:hypothetical protein